MRVLILVLLLLTGPLCAQEHLDSVYQRENERLDILLRWSPGSQAPVLPPVVKFEMEKVVPPSSRPPSSVERKAPEKNGLPRNYTTWIVNYNHAISLTEADSISRLIVKHTERHGVDPKLIVALVAAESAFRSDARSPVGAQGLGQLMPGTAAMLGVSRPNDPAQNLDGTVRYFSTQLRRWGSPALALASYNAGPGAVQKYGGIPPYRETQEYVRYVLKLHHQLESLERQQQAVSRRTDRSDS